VPETADRAGSREDYYPHGTIATSRYEVRLDLGQAPALTVRTRWRDMNRPALHPGRANIEPAPALTRAAVKFLAT